MWMRHDREIVCMSLFYRATVNRKSADGATIVVAVDRLDSQVRQGAMTLGWLGVVKSSDGSLHLPV